MYALLIVFSVTSRLIAESEGKYTRLICLERVQVFGRGRVRYYKGGGGGAGLCSPNLFLILSPEMPASFWPILKSGIDFF
jgi:hypothetical protein